MLIVISFNIATGQSILFFKKTRTNYLEDQSIDILSFPPNLETPTLWKT